MELSYWKIASNLNVALGTVYHIICRFIETGCDAKESVSVYKT